MLFNNSNYSIAMPQSVVLFTKIFGWKTDRLLGQVLFNDLWGMPNKTAATTFLTQWCNAVEEAKIPAFMAFAKTVKGHWSGIIHFVESRITNGLLEGINSKVQLAKRRARGYRNTDNFINMIYFLCGKMKFNYPLYFT